MLAKSHMEEKKMTSIPQDIEIDRSRAPVARGDWVDIAQTLKDKWTVEIGEMTDSRYFLN